MKVLIVDQMHESILGLLEKYGFTVNYAPKITREELFDQIGDYEGILIRSKTPLDRNCSSVPPGFNLLEGQELV